jgi:hypothetical protein
MPFSKGWVGTMEPGTTLIYHNHPICTANTYCTCYILQTQGEGNQYKVIHGNFRGEILLEKKLMVTYIINNQ